MAETGKLRRSPTPPEWIERKDGSHQLQGGRWNLQRVAEEILGRKNEKITPVELARVVYGTPKKAHVKAVRQSLSRQRNYMLARLTPIVTKYGYRGTIEYVQLFDRTIPEHQVMMNEEIERMESRKEISLQRATDLRRILGITS